MSDDRTYRIVRKKSHGDSKVIKEGLSLEQAQAHCSRDDTSGPGWMDVFYEEDPDPEMVREREERFHGMVSKMADTGLLGPATFPGHIYRCEITKEN